jgi:PhoPQ-activated pathogenicity-related protein
VGQVSGPGYHGAVLEMVSQTWLTSKEVDKPVWKHWLTVVVPDKVTHDKAFLFITGGDNTDAAPTKATDRFARMAVETNSVVAELDDVPNQPLRFTEDPKPRVEDEIIAYQQAKFAKDRNPLDLVRLPMVKSGVQAMTAVQQYLAGEAGGKLKVDGFVVSGGSKRAWTTWLVGALDRRVIAIIPIVINVLDVDATTRHHWEAMGYFSPALKDYVENGLIPKLIGSPGLNAVNRIEDPLNYRDRPSMKMPKYIINAVGDQYFPPDNTKFSYHLLPQTKRLRMIPNSKHSTAGTDINESMTAFYDAVLNHRPIPDYSWTVRRSDGGIVVRSATKPLEVNLWQGNDPKARDFRVDTIGPKAFTATPLKRQADGTWVGKVAKPPAGWTAYFVELVYPSGGKYPFKFTTEVSVIPDTLPYKWKDARPIIAPDGK